MTLVLSLFPIRFAVLARLKQFAKGPLHLFTASQPAVSVELQGLRQLVYVLHKTSVDNTRNSNILCVCCIEKPNSVPFILYIDACAATNVCACATVARPSTSHWRGRPPGAEPFNRDT
jgi:hypothetical protein